MSTPMVQREHCASCVETKRRFEAWEQQRSSVIAVAPVVEAVFVGDGLSLGIDEPGDGVGELRESESERVEPSGSVGELRLGDASSVSRLESVSLGVHEQVDLGGGVIGGSGHGSSSQVRNAERTDDCASCATVHDQYESFLTSRSGETSS